MGTLTQLAISSQPVQQQVIPPAGVSPVADPVFMAFVAAPSFGPVPDPLPGQFNTASWVTDPGPPATYWASCMVGPNNGGVVLAPGAYIIVVKVTDPAATPALPGWSLNIV